MADKPSTTRRTFFAIGAALAAPMPALAAPPPEPWDLVIAGFEVLSPKLADRARKAREQGYEPSDIAMVLTARLSSPDPALMMRGLGGGNEWIDFT